jgi:hypothetical protein
VCVCARAPVSNGASMLRPPYGSAWTASRRAGLRAPSAPCISRLETAARPALRRRPALACDAGPSPGFLHISGAGNADDASGQPTRQCRDRTMLAAAPLACCYAEASRYACCIVVEREVEAVYWSRERSRRIPRCARTMLFRRLAVHAPRQCGGAISRLRIHALCNGPAEARRSRHVLPRGALGTQARLRPVLPAEEPHLHANTSFKFATGTNDSESGVYS